MIHIERAPVLCNQLSHSREEALRAPVAPIQLDFCRSCGHVFNSAFEDALIQYGPEYENSLHFSARFRAYAASLVTSLAQRHSLGGRAVVEVGCGSGDFLRELAAASGGTGYGFDESYRGPSVSPEGVHFSTGSYFKEGVPETGLLCCRHVLEHVEDPRSFMKAIATSLAGQGSPAIYLEVPNALYTLRDLGIWDIIYEHPSYFTPSSLGAAVRSAGFQSIELEESFEGQFLSLHATIQEAPGEHDRESSPSDWMPLVEAFSEDYHEKTGKWKTRVAEAAGNGERIAVWGAGSKGSTFLNVIDQDRTVEFIVDLNPAKNGKFVSGSGHEIVAPEALRTRPVDSVILMNPVYEGEVREMLDSINPEATLTVA